MATAENLRSLVAAHFDSDKERFITIALQIAANEAKKGHIKSANEIKSLIDRNKKKSKFNRIALPLDLKGLILSEMPDIPKSSLVLSGNISQRLEQIIHEYYQRSKLKNHGLSHRRKILLVGAPGTGKTMTSKVLAHELKIPLFTIQVDRLVTKFMGETSSKLRQIFEMISQEHGVYLFDEFDAIGGERSLDNDVGEMRRVLNTFLQFIEQDQSDSVIVAATNNPKLLDHALFRRFDDILYYEKPLDIERKILIKNLLSSFMNKQFGWKAIIAESDDLSHSEISKACLDAIKKAVLEDRWKVSTKEIIASIKEKKHAYKGLR